MKRTEPERCASCVGTPYGDVPTFIIELLRHRVAPAAGL